MNRALLKQDAKDAMKSANPHPVVTTLVLFAISVVANSVIAAFGGLFTAIGALFRSEALTGISAFPIMIFSILASLLLGTISFGYSAYSLKVFKKEETGIGELFSYFPMLFKVFGLFLWMGLFVSLWSLLCVVPGIIAGLRYSQAVFIMAENPDKGILECVNESKELMSGRLWEYFVLQLSFILWSFLIPITCGIASIYVQPYMTVTYAGYYLSLKQPDTDGGYEYDGGYQN